MSEKNFTSYQLELAARKRLEARSGTLLHRSKKHHYSITKMARRIGEKGYKANQ